MEDWSVWRVAGVAAIAWLAWHVWRVHQFMARYYARPDDATSRAASNERGDDGTSSRSGSSYVLSNAHLRIVSDAEFEASIAEIEADVVRQARADAAASSTDGSLDEDSVKRIALARGVFGPGSITWRVGRESVIFLAGLRAALMQLAHPYVAIGVRHHSHIASGIQRRFYRTFKYMWAMAFGDMRQVIKAARAVRGFHSRVHGPEPVGTLEAGHQYNAHQVGALIWVFATLVESSIMMYEMIVEPLSEAEKELYYREQLRFMLLFGVDRAAFPPTWRSFMEYNRAIWHSDVLATGKAALELKEFLLLPPSPLFAPAMWWTGSITAVLLPPPLSRHFGFLRDVVDWVSFYVTFAIVRAVYPLLPHNFRFLTSYLEGERRNGIERWRLPGVMAAAMARWFLALLMPAKPKAASDALREPPSPMSPSMAVANDDDDDDDHED